MQKLINYFHPAGRPFICGFLAVTVLMLFLSSFLFVVCAVLTAWCFYFFRDPQRTVPNKPGLIVSPADGRIVAIREVSPEAGLGFGDAMRWRVSIFLNVFDVHVNRMPADGTVISKLYRKGTFVNASLDKASEDNERMALALKLSGSHAFAGQDLGVVQIAGLVARRIVCEAKEGDLFRAGERFGIIRFGSRADVYLPPNLVPLVAVGQYMIGGETVLADCTSSEPQRLGEVR